MRQKSIKLYNMILPIWLLAAFPIVWVIVIPANFIIDSLVVYFCMKKYKIQDIKFTYKKIILNVVCFGFVSDFVGGLFMLTSQFIPFSSFMDDTKWINSNFIQPIMYNPFKSLLSFIWVLVAMTISSILIYLLNYKFSFRNIEVDPTLKKKLSLILAVVTTPILFLLPTAWFW